MNHSYATTNGEEDTNGQRLELLSLRNSFNDTLKASFSLPARNNLFGFSVSKPLSLVVLNVKDNSFHLSQAAREYLAALEGECYVISVSGSPLVGKSSLLNLLLSLFTYYNNDIYAAADGVMPYKDIYTVGDGKKSTTEGIDMYCITAGNKNYIFLDVEGDNDPMRKDTGIWIYSNLITTAIGASHTHIYNYNGLPQENFFNYFESISKLVKQNKLHPQFETQYTFLKRNHAVETEEDLLQDLEEYKEYFDEKLSHGEENYSIYMINNPPHHITDRRDKESCVATTGFVCSACQSDFFMAILLGIYKDLENGLKEKEGFKNGLEIVESLDKILTINKKELPYFVDAGNIAKIRIDRFRKEQLRISDGLAQVENYNSERNLSKQIQKIFNDHPNLTDIELFRSFDHMLNVVVIKISQMEYLIPELSKFVEECLIDDGYSIMDPTEKEIINETYIQPFDQLTKGILEALKEYEKIIEEISAKILLAKGEIIVNLKEFKLASSDAKSRSAVVATNVVASSVLGFVAREVAVKVLAGCLIGGTAVGAVLTVYAFYQAKKKWSKSKKDDKMVAPKKVVGINNNQEADDEIKRVNEFIDALVKDLEENNKVLKEICKEEKSRNYNLIKKIEEVVDKKLSGEQIDIDDRVKLIQYMKVAQNNLERFKQST